MRGRYFAGTIFVALILASIGTSLLSDSPMWRSLLIALVIGIPGFIALFLFYRKNGEPW
jgi:hypothetical protein